MEIKIEYDKNYGYTATIKEFGIVTEGENFDELIKNITEAINCYYETEKKDLIKKAKFYLSFENNASFIQTNS